MSAIESADSNARSHGAKIGGELGSAGKAFANGRLAGHFSAEESPGDRESCATVTSTRLSATDAGIAKPGRCAKCNEAPIARQLYECDADIPEPAQRVERDARVSEDHEAIKCGCDARQTSMRRCRRRAIRYSQVAPFDGNAQTITAEGEHPATGPQVSR